MDWLDKLNRKIGHLDRPGEQGGGEQRQARAAGGTVVRKQALMVSPANAPLVIPAAETQVAAEWKIGDVILDLYEVKQIHEGGGMGLVYRVYHRGWNTDIAVKSPRSDYFQTEEQKENFTRECETWISLGLHPHIVSCYHVRSLGGSPRIFAEYVEDGSLEEWIVDRRLYVGGPQVALKRILDIAIQTAWGLHYAHEQGLIHQDVKPANVLMTPDGIAKIGDFGLAKARIRSGESAVKDTKRTILVSSGGMTPAYCSPEQADSQPLTRKTDIWSWAVSVLQMFTGEATWQSGIAAPNVLRGLSKLQAEGVGLPEIPVAMRELLGICLEFDPARRPRDLIEISRKLAEIYQCHLNESYARLEPAAAEVRADSLNNRGLSLLDLGKREEAEKLWEEALQSEPHHLEATYNLGLALWRTGRMTREELLRGLRESEATVGNRTRVTVLRTQVLLESDDCEGAVSALEALEGADSEQRDVQAMLLDARHLLPTSRRCLRTFEGQTPWVISVCLSSDGRFVLSGSGDKTLKLLELATGNCLQTFVGHTGCVQAVVLSTDGRCALSGGNDEKLKLWDLASGGCIRTFEGHTDIVSSVCLSKDRRYALSGSHDKTLKLWDVETGQCMRSFEGHRRGVLSLCLSSDGKSAMSGSWDKTVRLWDVATGRCLRTFEGHTGGALSLSLSADGRFALSGSEDGTLKLWEVATGRCLRTFEGHMFPVKSACLSPDGRLALSGGGDDTLRFWETETGRCVRTVEEQNSVEVCLDTTGRFGLSGSGDTLKLWQVAGNADCFQAPAELSRLATTAAVSSASANFRQLLETGKEALARGASVSALRAFRNARHEVGFQRDHQVLDEYARLYSLLPRTKLVGGWEDGVFNGHSKVVQSVCLSADGLLALSGSDDRTLKLWETSTGQCLRTFEGHADLVLTACLSADGHYALSGSYDGILMVWEVMTERCLRTFQGHKYEVISVCLSADSRLALSGSTDRTLKLWSVSTGQCLRTFEGYTGCLSSDGRFVLSGNGDDKWKLWDVVTGRCLRTFEGHVGKVCLSADDRFALSTCDGDLKLWDVATGRCLHTIEGHTRYVSSICLSADGRFALSGSYDRTLKLWELATGRCLRTFEGHTNEVNSVCLSADGRFAVSGGNIATLKRWFLDWELEEKEPADWDEGARPYLDVFLRAHQPYAAALPEDRQLKDEEVTRALTRVGRPVWNDENWLSLLRTLGCAGYGWLRPKGVGRELEKMAANWKDSQ